MPPSLATTSPTGELELLDTNATRSPAARSAAMPSAAGGIASSPRQTTPSRSHATTGGLVTYGHASSATRLERGAVVGLVGPHRDRELEVPAGTQLGRRAA